MARKGFDAAGFKRDMRALRREITAEARAAMDKGSHLLADEVQSNAPDRAGIDGRIVVGPVRAERGVLAQDVTIGDGPGPDVAAVEFGSSRRGPDPFIRRSIHATESAMVRLIEGAFPAE